MDRIGILQEELQDAVGQKDIRATWATINHNPDPDKRLKTVTPRSLLIKHETDLRLSPCAW